MTEHDPGRPWWEFDPEERPVPLIGVADEAEGIVRSAQEAIAREDTDPAVFSSGRRPGARASTSALRRPVGRVAALVLLAGCIGMFVFGWRDGSALARMSSPAIPTQSTTLHEGSLQAPVMKATSGDHRGGLDNGGRGSIPKTKGERKK